MTFWPGVKVRNCQLYGRSRNIEADKHPYSITIPNSLIWPRKDTSYESCYWIAEAPEGKYQATAKINVRIDECQNGRFFIYEGRSRSAAILRLEQDSPLLEPNNINIPVNSGAIIVFMTVNDAPKPSIEVPDNQYSGVGKFTVSVIGEEIPFL